MERTECLTFTTMLLWMLFNAAPTWDEYSPILEVGESFRVSLYQAFNLMVVGVATYLSSFAWLHSVLRGHPCPIRVAVPFLFFSFYVWTGHGVHAACVVAESMMKDTNHPVFGLLDFLHERVSHNMFVGGYFGILMVIMCAEILAALQWMKAMKEEDKVAKINSLPSKGRFEQFFSNWVLPLVYGAYFSIFASRTGTVLVTSLFYCSVIVLLMVTIAKLSFMGISWSLLIQHSGLFTFFTFLYASVFGTIVLAFVML